MDHNLAKHFIVIYLYQAIFNLVAIVRVRAFVKNQGVISAKDVVLKLRVSNKRNDSRSIL